MSMNAEKLAAFYKLAFQPMPNTGSGSGPDIDAALRVAHAAEYAAAQLGTIARMAKKIEAHLAVIAAHYLEPGSIRDLLRKTT